MIYVNGVSMYDMPQACDICLAYDGEVVCLFACFCLFVVFIFVESVCMCVLDLLD